MAEINFPDPAVTNPWQDPVSLQWWQHDGAGWLRVSATEEPILTGYKNVLINGDFRINQREFNGDWSPVSIPDVYGYDRWTKVSDGPDRIGQRIEILNLVAGATYTLSWDDGTLTDGLIVNGDGTTSVFGPSPIIGTIGLTGGIPQVEVPFDATNIQLELGSVQTNFEVRPIGLELSLCHRYFYGANALSVLFAPRYSAADNLSRTINFFLPVQMRVSSPIATVTTSTLSNIESATVRDGLVLRVDGQAEAPASNALLQTVEVDAEL